MRNLAYDLDNDDLRASPKSFRDSIRSELTLQPYCGAFLFFLLFEDNSDEIGLMQQCLDNLTSFDLRVYLSTHNIEDPTSYYDANRIMKIHDKMP